MSKLTTELFIEKAKLIHGDKYDYSKVDYNGCKHNILLIESFTSKYTTKEELITIFNQSNIYVIFIDQLFNTSDKINKQLTYNELLEENKNLKELLKKYEDKL